MKEKIFFIIRNTSNFPLHCYKLMYIPDSKNLSKSFQFYQIHNFLTKKKNLTKSLNLAQIELYPISALIEIILY